jgi:hypothetical protein
MVENQPTAGDELLRWVSEAGFGTWPQLRDACAYVAQKHRLQRRPWILASNLSALGHLDIDWETRSWSVAPPALNLVPGLGLCLVLTGSRPYYLDQRFQSVTDEVDVYPFGIAQPPLPEARFAKCATVEVAEIVASGLGGSLVVDPSRQLAEAVVPIDQEKVALAPEPALDEAERFNPDALKWDGQHERRPGLYRFDLHGRKAHRRLVDGSWWSVDLPAGQFLELRGREQPVLQWRAPDGRKPAWFEVRYELALPIIAERAATVSSGLTAEYRGGWRCYRNVPRSIAEHIAGALLQPLAVV